MAITTHKSGFADSVSEALRSVADRASGKRARVFFSAAPILVEFFFAVTIGVIVAKLVFALFAPAAIPETLPASAAGGPAAAAPIGYVNSPFRIAAVEATAPPPDETAAYEETQLDLTLHGVFVFEGVPTAIISTPDGKQGSFGIGETIWSDAELERIVSSVQVVILVSGARETLTLKNRDPKSADRGARPSGPSPAPVPPPAQGSGLKSGALPIGDVARLSLAPSNNGPAVVIQPGPNRGAFNAAGLKPGDILISVNNRRIGPDLASESARFANLAQSGQIRLLVERNGTPVPVEINLAGNGR